MSECQNAPRAFWEQAVTDEDKYDPSDPAHETISTSDVDDSLHHRIPWEPTVTAEHKYGPSALHMRRVLLSILLGVRRLIPRSGFPVRFLLQALCERRLLMGVRMRRESPLLPHGRSVGLPAVRLGSFVIP